MNEYFQTGAVPAPSSPGASSVMRQEFANIAAGFDKLPVLAGHQNKIVTINAAGDAMVASDATLGDLATLTGNETITNKTLAWANNTFDGFGSAAIRNAGSSAGEVLLMIDNQKLPSLDASNLVNIPGLSLKADANNAVLTGAPVCPTPVTGDSSSRIANTQFVTDTVQAIGAFAPSNAAPLMNGAAAPGSSGLGSRSDHVHPVDTSRAPDSAKTAAGTSFTPSGAVSSTNVQAAIAELDTEKAALNSPVFTGTPTAPNPTAGANNNELATTAFVQGELASKAPLDSPALTGTPTAPTPLVSDNDTSIATTAFVQTLVAQQPFGMQPSNANPLINGTVSAGTSVDGSRADHVHPVDTSRAPASAATASGTAFTASGNIAATNVQAAIQELDAEKATLPTGTRMIFAQSAAPVGWTQDVSDNANNRMLRVVSGTGNGIGGSHSPILNNVVPSHTHGITTGTESVGHSHSFTTGTVSADHSHSVNDPGHNHEVPVGAVGGGVWGYTNITQGSTVTTYGRTTGVSLNGISANHTHSGTTGGAGAAHTHSGTTDNGSSQTNWTPRYIDLIICSKN